MDSPHTTTFKTLPVLAIVAPCYNEEEVLPETIKRLDAILHDLATKKRIAASSFMLFVDDGSKDKTWDIIFSHSQKSPTVKGVKLSRNFGHQNALLAGLMSAKQHSDVVITMDADLQHDEMALYEFIEKYHAGNEIVYGVRNSRETDSAFKGFTALFFYKLMQSMDVQIIKNHADYRLMSKRAIDTLATFEEVNLFLRGILPLLGFKTTTLRFDVKDRFAGKSKFSVGKMMAFALNGITSFSIVPIRVITVAGFLIFVFSVAMSIFVVLSKFFGSVTTGWTSTVLPIYLIGGIQLLSLGLIGEYVGKIYQEVKRRPRFIIEEEL
jgi:glycosyltransferase involved in cell wall biosynthesis